MARDWEEAKGVEEVCHRVNASANEVNELRAQVRHSKGENMELVRRMQGMRMDARRTNARTNRSQVICYKCGMRGHMARWCRNQPLHLSGQPPH